MFFSRKNFLILSLLILVNGMLFLDGTILFVALPTIQKSFQSNDVQLQWMVNSFLLASTIFVANCGKIADQYGHKKIFQYGLFLFGFASLLCGLAQNSWQMILFRFLQGIGTAMVVPSSMAILWDVFPENQRGKAMGIISASNSIFLTIGPLVGGFITEYFSWHYIFFINIPIVIAALFLAMKKLKPSRKIPSKIDFFGFFTFTLGFFFFTLAIMQAQQWGWLSGINITLIIGSFICFYLLYKSEKRTKDPFIDFKLWKNHSFLGGTIAIFATSFVRMISVFWILYFQNVLGLSPIQSGLVSVFTVFPMIFTSPIGGKIVDKFGPKKPVIIGNLIMLSTFLWIALLIQKQYLFILLPGLFFYSIGMVLIYIAAYTSALNSVPPSQRGVASGLLSTFRNAGVSLGVTVLGAIVANIQASSFSTLLKSTPATASENPQLFDGLLSNSPHATEALQKLPLYLQTFVIKGFKDTYTLGLAVANFLAAGVILLSLILFWRLFRIKNKKIEAQIPFEPE